MMPGGGRSSQAWLIWLRGGAAWAPSLSAAAMRSLAALAVPWARTGMGGRLPLVGEHVGELHHCDALAVRFVGAVARHDHSSLSAMDMGWNGSLSTMYVILPIRKTITCRHGFEAGRQCVAWSTWERRRAKAGQSGANCHLRLVPCSAVERAGRGETDYSGASAPAYFQ